MRELERALIADSFAAPPSHILEGVGDGLAHCVLGNAPHALYAELWHLAYWQQMSLDWIGGVETPVPEHASAGFPDEAQTNAESWPGLCQRFLAGVVEAAKHAAAQEELEREIRCPSLPGVETRIMTIREQLENLAAHNAYHLGRIVLLRQLAGAWPPPSGGFTW